MGEPLMKRRKFIEKHVLQKLADPIRYSPVLEGKLADLIASVKAQGWKASSRNCATRSMNRACAPVFRRK